MATNHPDSESAAQHLDGHARRMAIKACIQESIHCFHLDALSAGVPFRIEVDLQIKLMASSLYRLL